MRNEVFEMTEMSGLLSVMQVFATFQFLSLIIQLTNPEPQHPSNYPSFITCFVLITGEPRVGEVCCKWWILLKQFHQGVMTWTHKLKTRGRKPIT